MSTKPRFSIVIPTRDRAETLRWSLATCVAQEFDDCEFLVSDNFSAPEVRAVVEACADPRVRYVRTPELLAMTDSWEFAVGHAKGEYITVLGDDDGLMLHALPEIDRIISVGGPRALRWESAVYRWPNLPPTDSAEPNRLTVPMNKRNGMHAIQRHRSRAMLAAAALLDAGYWQFPMIYNSVIHWDLLAELRRRTGRVFKSRCPDCYIAFAVAALVEEYASCDAPMAISGVSGKSNGYAHLVLKEETPIREEFAWLNSRENFVPHRRTIELKSLTSVAMDSFLIARDELFPDVAELNVDYRAFAERCLSEVALADEDHWNLVRRTIAEALSFDTELVAWFEMTYGDVTFAVARTYRKPAVYQHYTDRHLHLDASEFGVTNVFEAAQLCEKLFGFKREGTNSHFLPTATEPTPTGLISRAKHKLARMLSRAA